MVKRLVLVAVLAGTLQLPAATSVASGVVESASADADNDAIACSVMEAFEDAKLGVSATIFHQRDKVDGPRLGALLLAHTGQEMELTVGSSQTYRATVFRVKSAFGRGLVLLPTNKVKLRAGDDFTLRAFEKN